MYWQKGFDRKSDKEIDEKILQIRKDSQGLWLYRQVAGELQNQGYVKIKENYNVYAEAWSTSLLLSSINSPVRTKVKSWNGCSLIA